MIDVDSDDTEEEVIEKLGEPFSSASYVFATSASNGIAGKKGFHLYFGVKDSSDIKAAMNNIFNSAFLNGYGKAELSKSGSILLRTFFDKAVYDQGRLDFISGPVCEGFDAPVRDIRYVEKDNDIIDLAPLLAPVDASEVIEEIKRGMRGEQDEIIKTIAAKKGISEASYRSTLESSTVSADFILYKPENTPLRVKEVLLKSAYGVDGSIEIQHPLEGGLSEKTILYYNPDTLAPVVHSFAHGGQTWTLEWDRETIESFEGDKEDLAKQVGFLDTPEEAELFERHPETEAVFQMMQYTFLNDYQNPRILEEQWKYQIDLYLHLLDGKEGRYSIELKMASAKTQVLLHLILYLYSQQKTIAISLSFEKIEEIENNYNWLLSRLQKIWEAFSVEERCSFPYTPEEYLKRRHSKERTPFGELRDTLIILHTHHVIRTNDFTDTFFTYQNQERHLFIYDEALNSSLEVSLKCENAIDHLNYIISRGDSGKLDGVPIKYLGNLRKKLVSAQRKLTRIKAIKAIDIEIPQLSERFIKTGYYIDDEKVVNFIVPLFYIAASEERSLRVSREKGASALLSFKENQVGIIKRLVTTDASREVRKIHKYTKNKIQRYPIPEWTQDEKSNIWIAPFKSTGKEAVSNILRDEGQPSLSIGIINQFLEEKKPEDYGDISYLVALR